MDDIDFKRLAEVSRDELAENYGLNLDIDFGDDFLNSLFLGTLKTFADRVDSSGFCQTSYGECGNVKCYGVTHYPRDAAEAGRVLAMVGLYEKARAILDFTLRNIPQGQTYIPHVYNFDGSVRYNTVQVDTPGIVATLLSKLVELQPADDFLNKCYGRLKPIFNETWKTHFHSELNLLDAGNYNEQFDGGAEVICDIFTNTAVYAGFKAMAAVAGAFDDPESQSKFDRHANILADGIEKNLHDTEEGFYRTHVTLSNGQAGPIGWHSFYCSRWYPMLPKTLETTFEFLKTTTTLKVGDFNIISCEPNQEHRILGKIFGRLIGYLAQTGKHELLREHLDFAKKNIRKPANIFPEWWYLTEDKNPAEYWQGFWKKYKGIWTPYDQDIEGDYTVDSGNCEQCAVFLAHMLEDVSKIDLT